VSREIHQLRYPDGAVVSGDFAVATRLAQPARAGEITVAVYTLSMDPIVRTRMTATPAMGPPIGLGSVVPGRGVGRVVASDDPRLPVGTAVFGELGWQEVAVVPAASLEVVTGPAPLHHHLNALGPTGLAAWFLIEDVAPIPGETLLIAPGAGAVGSIVAQLARRAGARVVATAVGAVQRDYLTGLGVEPVDPAADLPAADIVIEGIGGDFHDRALAAAKPRARVRLLGFLADYGRTGPLRYGSMGPVLMKRLRVEGFLLADYMARADAARAGLAAAIAAGTLVPAETIWHGLDQAPHAFAALFGDARPGKHLVHIRSDV